MMTTNYLKMILKKNSGQNKIERLKFYYEKERQEETKEQLRGLNDNEVKNKT